MRSKSASLDGKTFLKMSKICAGCRRQYNPRYHYTFPMRRDIYSIASCLIQHTRLCQTHHTWQFSVDKLRQNHQLIWTFLSKYYKSNQVWKHYTIRGRSYGITNLQNVQIWTDKNILETINNLLSPKHSMTH